MGVPKFFWYISARYPCLSEQFKEFEVPDFDNFYLDMNGIIHVCSHPDDFDPYFRITEENIFASIFHYIEVLFNMIKPKKLLFMAVDGVAPRAKMNQQRARRFMTAKEAEVKVKEALRKGDVPFPTDRFDRNCITPGTVFMDRLHSQLKYFVTNKVSTDPLWQGCKVILSGHQTPGEGEHKIMEYIRYLKTLPDYDENTRHCLYGLDADLIMLGLCTHEPHFCLLREKIVFSRQQKKRTSSPDEKEFTLLHLSLLREYLDLEFQNLKETLPFSYNLEKIIDDWPKIIPPSMDWAVKPFYPYTTPKLRCLSFFSISKILMSFLLGNDFIPSLPDFHINKGAVQILYKAYKQVLPTLDGYLNENGYLNFPRFQQFMEELADHELENFEDTYANLAFLEEKTGRCYLSDKKPNGEEGRKSDLEELIKATDDLMEMSDEEFPDEETDTFLWEFAQHKKNYYTDKLDYSNVTPEVLKSQAEGYVRALQWNLHYYYHGIQSWSWFYPHHYAPCISDVTNFKDMKLDFEMGKPFLPFEQLLAILPPASKSLLPEAYHDLMVSPNSPIKDYYPEDFKTDLNGKQQDWEAVVLIPFIEEKRLLDAMKGLDVNLTQEEKRRNRHGPMHIYSYTRDNLGVYKSPEYFPSVTVNHALVQDVFREEVAVEICNLKYGLRPGVSLGVLSPGFPSLEHVPHTASIKLTKIREYFPKGESMVLTVTKRIFPPLEALASSLLGKVIHIHWPHLIESRAVAVANKEVKFTLTQNSGIEREVLSKRDRLEWLGEGETLTREYLALGVELGPIEVIVYVSVLEGQKCVFGPSERITYEKIWSNTSTPCPLQVIVTEGKGKERKDRSYMDSSDAFPVGSTVFMLGQPHFGCSGRVIDSPECQKGSRLNVELQIVSDPVVPKSFGRSDQKTVYFPRRVAALKVGISPTLLSRITGNILVSMTNEEGLSNPGSKINIGLGMKNFKNREEISGYTKRDPCNWLFSMKAIAVVAAYVEKFSRVVEYLSDNQYKNVFFVQDIFPGPEGAEEMKEILAWVKEQEFNKAERIQWGSSTLAPEHVLELEKLVENTPKTSFTRCIQVRPHLLYKNELYLGNIPPVKTSQHQLLDRVVSIRSSHTVPTGLRGFIIGIYPGAVDADCTYDVLFDTPFLGGSKRYSSSEKVFRMSRNSFLNITDGNRPRTNQPSSSHPNVVHSKPANAAAPKMSAFAQWSQQPPRAPAQANDDDFKKIWSSLQSTKPQEDLLKKILKIKETESGEIEDPVKSFFENVTKASNAVPRTPEQNSVHTQSKQIESNKYYLQLFSHFQRKNLGQPKFKYIRLDGKVMAQILLKDGRVYNGLPCDDKESACESASLQALGALDVVPLDNEALLLKEREKEKKIMENQMKLSNALLRTKADNTKRTSQVRPPQSNYPPGNRMPPLLPNPPSQWVNRNSQQRGIPFYPPRENFHNQSKKENSEKPSQNSVNSGIKKPSASALEFVPLQVITGKRTVGRRPTIQSSQTPPEPPKKPEVVATINSNPGTTSTTAKPRRRPKIAAKLNLDLSLC